MKDTLDYLNLQKQREVAYIRKVILDELSARLRASKSKRTSKSRAKMKIGVLDLDLDFRSDLAGLGRIYVSKVVHTCRRRFPFRTK